MCVGWEVWRKGDVNRDVEGNTAAVEIDTVDFEDPLGAFSSGPMSLRPSVLSGAGHGASPNLADRVKANRRTPTHPKGHSQTWDRQCGPYALTKGHRQTWNAELRKFQRLSCSLIVAKAMNQYGGFN